MSGHNRAPCPHPRHTGHSVIRAAAAAAVIIVLAVGACSSTTTSTASATAGIGPSGRPGHPHRGRFDVRRAVLLPGLHSIPSASPGGHRDLFRRGQQRGHRRDQRPAGRLRRLRRAHERQRAGSRPRRPGHPGARRPGRRRRGLQPQPPGGYPAAPDRPGPGRHLPRADHPLERPGHHRPQPGYHPPGRSDHRRAPLRRQRHHLHLQQLPVQRLPGLGGQGRHRQDAELAGRRGRRRQQQRDLYGVPHPFSIGYVEQAYSQGLVLPFAEIRNQAGNYVLPTTQTVAAAAAQKPAITPADFSIVNQPGAASYPISGYSWALIYTHQPSQATGQALVSMLNWLAHRFRPGLRRRQPLRAPASPRSSNSPSPACPSKSPDPAGHTS